MQNLQTRTALAVLVCAASALSAMATDITGKPIFEDKPSAVAPIQKVLADGDALAEGELKLAQIKYAQAQLKTRARVVGLLDAAKSAAARGKDGDALAAIARERAQVTTQMADLKARLREWSAPEAAPEMAPANQEPVKTAVAMPVNAPAPKPIQDPVKISVVEVASPSAAELPPLAIASADIPKLMLGKWKCVEQGRVCGYYILKDNGVVHSFAKLKANGAPSPTIGTWKVWDNGDISFVNDDDSGNDMLRVNLVAETKACGCHHLRQSDAQPYKVGPKVVELVRDEK